APSVFPRVAERSRGGRKLLSPGRDSEYPCGMDPEEQKKESPVGAQSLSEWADLPPRNQFWIMEEAESRLRDNFPSLLARLKQATSDSKSDNSFENYAAEHFLTAEALVELLEASNGETLLETSLQSELQKRVIEKVKQFSARPDLERELIKRVYTELDPARIA